MTSPPELARSIREYYERFDEEERLSDPYGQLEFVRNAEIISRHLPAPPATVLDVGGAAGRYSCWLALQGYEVHLVDPMPGLVEQARRASALQPDAPIASCRVGDARALEFGDGSAAAVLLFGPLYHLVRKTDRHVALRETRRVLEPGGVLLAAGISRFASALDGLIRGFIRDDEFLRILERDLLDGQHRNPTDNISYFTESFFHHPDELVAEAEQAGFESVEVAAVEGLGCAISDLERYWNDDALRQRLLDLLRRLEREPALIGASPHLVCIARRGAEEPVR